MDIDTKLGMTYTLTHRTTDCAVRKNETLKSGKVLGKTTLFRKREDFSNEEKSDQYINLRKHGGINACRMRRKQRSKHKCF